MCNNKVAIAVAALVLTGCSSGGGGNSQRTPPTQSHPTPTPTPTPVPVPAPAPQPQLLGSGRSVVAATEAGGATNLAWVALGGITFARSTDGVSFTQTQLPASNVSGLQLSASGTVITLLWTSSDSSGNQLTYLAESSDNGGTFAVTTLPQVLSPTPALVGATVLWSQNGALMSSTGATIAPAVPGTDVLDITGAVGTQGQLYVFWVQEVAPPGGCAVLGAASFARGTWTQPVQLSAAPALACSISPTAHVAADGTIDVAWTQDGTLVMRTRSTDQAQTWSAPATVATGTAVTTPSAATAANGTTYVTWSATTDGVYNVLLSNGQETPQTLSGPQRLSFTGAAEPQLLLDATDAPTVSFGSDAGGAAAGDFGVYVWSGGAVQQLTNAPTSSDSPILLLGGGVAWADNSTQQVWWQVRP